MRLHEDMGRSFSRVTPAFVFLLSLARSSHAAVISARIMHEKNDRAEVHAELREDFRFIFDAIARSTASDGSLQFAREQTESAAESSEHKLSEREHCHRIDERET